MDTGRGAANDVAAAGRPSSHELPWLAYELVAAALRQNPHEVSPALDHLHGPVRDEHGLLQVMTASVTVLVAAFDVVSAACLTVGSVRGGGWQPVASSSVAARLNEVQQRIDDGPGLRAVRTGRPVSLTHTDVSRVWPDLAASMKELAVAATWSRPVLGRDTGSAVAVIDLHLSSAAVAVPDRAGLEALVRLVGGIVERALSDVDAQRAARLEVGALQEAMANRGVIEQAKGILMADHGVDADEAFSALVRMARPANRKVREVAEALVQSTARRGGPADRAVEDVREQIADRRGTAFDHSMIGTAITDVAGTIEACNQALTELFGARSADLVGRSLFSLTHTEDLPVAHDACEQLQRSEARRSQCLVRFVRLDGVVVPTRVLAAKVSDEQGRPTHLVMQLHRHAHDVSARGRRRP